MLFLNIFTIFYPTSALNFGLDFTAWIEVCILKYGSMYLNFEISYTKMQNATTAAVVEMSSTNALFLKHFNTILSMSN